ncbi:MAG: phosphatase PAP2 family protein [Erysipelotrichaceae bacterium]|jgi:membrane-associated phospholipid phosphatase|nr:phosphatase PAP2 family protein [Erysipelotrichaceae bacterium]
MGFKVTRLPSIVCGVSILCFIAILLTYKTPVFQLFDQYFLELAQNANNPVFVLITKIISVFADGKAIAVIAIILFIFSKKKNNALLFAGIALATYFITLWLTDVFLRKSPPTSLETSALLYSFPSIPVTVASVSYGYLFNTLLKLQMRNIWRILGLVMLVVLVAAICFSQLYLRCNYFTDVAAGASLGAIVLSFYYVSRQIVLQEREILLKQKELHQ